MQRWYRIFAAAAEGPAPETLLEYLNSVSPTTGEFGGDAAGWFRADLCCDELPVLYIERYRVDEVGIRAELNGWAAWVETRDDQAALMERIIQTKQLFTLQGGDDPLCAGLCRFVAQATDGIWQADGAGLFDAGGSLLLADDDG